MVELPKNPTDEQLCAFIKDSDLEYATVGFVDFQGAVRAKYVSRKKLESALEEMAFPLISLVLDPTDAILFAPNLADPDSGFSDRPARLVSQTACLLPWEREGRNLFILAEFTGEGELYCPRGLYRRVYDKSVSLGFQPCHSLEYEFTLFNETSQSAFDKGYRDLQVATPHKSYYSLVRQGTQSEFYNQLMDMAALTGISLESLHEEMGPGFMEAALQYGAGVDVADSAVLFRTFAKIIAQRNDMLMSFMARWSNDADGQSGHVHMSLADLEGQPLFHDDGDADKMSQTMKYFIGGLQAAMGDFLLMFAPNINSFKRLVPGIFAPISAEWGIENRTCAIRAIPGKPKSSRIECRTPGADSNPYLSLAGVLAAGLYGIENRIEPSQPTKGNAYEAEVPEALRLPGSFAEAIERFRGSSVARSYFGDMFVDAYADTRAEQLHQFAAMVTDRELERFFELV
ncbi:glutamine synthetase family protein [Emcibacter nanhaiensis]|uniref:Glutamine synthetase n=1 Tax=Emcibacter nanhaiensis TaxID=1505037 RepID=A0A501PL51_9PROT|nr:glutamine synthetase family protein [Emcibacter nanhaiensis]TPD60654.1 glutamine synthetase [Emcibacter nanhaiensis]